MEATAMAGFGRFKLTDAIPEQAVHPEPAYYEGGSHGTRGKGKRKGQGKAASPKGQHSANTGPAAEQLREARESNQAKNAEGSVRDRMVDIGRGNQQAGRQRAK